MLALNEFSSLPGGEVGDATATKRATALIAESDQLKEDLFLSCLQPVKHHLYNFIRKSLSFSAQGDDLFQESLLKAFRYFSSYDRRRSFKTWIFTIAHNLIKDFFQKNQAMASYEEIPEATLDDCVDVQQVKEIYQIANHLKPKQRQVFFLYYDSEFKVAEIARITGLSRANIKFILHQARLAIRKTLEVKHEKN